MIKLDYDYGKGKHYAAIPFIATISSLRDIATVLPHNREEGIKSNQIGYVMLYCIYVCVYAENDDDYNNNDNGG